MKNSLYGLTDSAHLLNYRGESYLRFSVHMFFATFEGASIHGSNEVRLID